MNKIDIKKEFYNKFITQGILEIESYVDFYKKNDIDSEIFNNFFNEVNNYYKLEKELFNQREIVYNKLILLIEKIGYDKFDIDENGNISLICNGDDR